jgi:hypothetical protein
MTSLAEFRVDPSVPSSSPKDTISTLVAAVAELEVVVQTALDENRFLRQEREHLDAECERLRGRVQDLVVGWGRAAQYWIRTSKAIRRAHARQSHAVTGRLIRTVARDAVSLTPSSFALKH